MGRSLPGRRVLVVDGNDDFLEAGRRLLAEHDVVMVRSVDEALQRVAADPVDLIVLGPSNATASGLEAAGSIVAADPVVSMVLAADVTTNRILKVALRTGLDDVFDTPLTSLALEDALERAPTRADPDEQVGASEPDGPGHMTIDVHLESERRAVGAARSSEPHIDLVEAVDLMATPGPSTKGARGEDDPGYWAQPMLPGTGTASAGEAAPLLDAPLTLEANGSPTPAGGTELEDQPDPDVPATWDGLPIVELPPAVWPGEDGLPDDPSQPTPDGSSPAPVTNGAEILSGPIGAAIGEEDIPPRPQEPPPVPAGPPPNPHSAESDDDRKSEQESTWSFLSFLTGRS
jgi:hypothetical protein